MNLKCFKFLAGIRWGIQIIWDHNAKWENIAEKVRCQKVPKQSWQTKCPRVVKRQPAKGRSNQIEDVFCLETWRSCRILGFLLKLSNYPRLFRFLFSAVTSLRRIQLHVLTHLGKRIAPVYWQGWEKCLSLFSTFVLISRLVCVCVCLCVYLGVRFIWIFKIIQTTKQETVYSHQSVQPNSDT